MRMAGTKQLRHGWLHVSTRIAPQRGSTAWLHRFERTKRQRRKNCSRSSIQPAPPVARARATADGSSLPNDSMPLTLRAVSPSAAHSSSD